MKITVNLYQFRDAFQRMDRNNFSYEGLEILFDYLEEYEDSTGEELELDVVGLCCDYSEDSPEDIAENYDIDLSDVDPDDEDSLTEIVLDYLNDHTIVVGQTDKSIIYLQF